MILATTIVMMADYPVYNIMCSMIQILASMLLIGYIEPFKLKSDNYMLLMNESFVMLTAYNLICLTDFNAEQSNQFIMGYSMVGCTTLNMSINMGLML